MAYYYRHAFSKYCRWIPHAHSFFISIDSVYWVSTVWWSFYLAPFSSFSTSTWELPGSSSSEPEEQNPVQQHKTPKESVTLPSSMSHIPGWLTDYFLSLAPEKRLPVFEAWKHHTIHGLCCPLSWMHRNCIAGFAVSAALHYLKCPYCANREIFIRSIIDTGIWVPDQ